MNHITQIDLSQVKEVAEAGKNHLGFFNKKQLVASDNKDIVDACCNTLALEHNRPVRKITITPELLRNIQLPDDVLKLEDMLQYWLPMSDEQFDEFLCFMIESCGETLAANDVNLLFGCNFTFVERATVTDDCGTALTLPCDDEESYPMRVILGDSISASHTAEQLKISRRHFAYIDDFSGGGPFFGTPCCVDGSIIESDDFYELLLMLSDPEYLKQAEAQRFPYTPTIDICAAPASSVNVNQPALITLNVPLWAEQDAFCSWVATHSDGLLGRNKGSTIAADTVLVLELSSLTDTYADAWLMPSPFLDYLMEVCREKAGSEQAILVKLTFKDE